jgi:hypothetical protein
MNQIRLFRPARLLLAALLALPCALLPAQEETPTPKARAPRAETDTISIDFPGGSLSKLAAKLNEAGAAKLSIVQSPGLDPTLPAFSVHNVRVHAVIAALGGILEPQGFRLMPVDSNLAVLSKIEESRNTGFASFQLDRKLEKGPNEAAGRNAADEIVAAIQQGCEFANSGRASTLRFKYHAGTKLLFVSGSSQEVDIAYKVFASLPDRSSLSQPTPPPEKK